MANQIAANLAAQGEAAAVEQTAQHIRLYWDPRMKAALREIDMQDLSPIAKEAAAQVLDRKTS
ncbi:formate dehydrogenase [Novosphingobium umbonatum]|uniref:Formate dehydrogenase n=2 Tax=Novosphingobium umbonatum TaxID=1908524 RepID=A0A437N2I5_9SPHN|nr:formate dehydrogenase [Novosphingobium umbonatum]